MISVKMAVLALIGLSAGAVVAGGIFAFLAIIGVYVRLMGKTGTKKHTLLFETFIILGGILGNLWDIYEFPLLMGHFFGAVFLAGSGLFMGIFVGCLDYPGRDFRKSLGYLRISPAYGPIFRSCIFGKLRAFYGNLCRLPCNVTG